VESHGGSCFRADEEDSVVIEIYPLQRRRRDASTPTKTEEVTNTNDDLNGGASQEDSSEVRTRLCSSEPAGQPAIFPEFLPEHPASNDGAGQETQIHEPVQVEMPKEPSHEVPFSVQSNDSLIPEHLPTESSDVVDEDKKFKSQLHFEFPKANENPSEEMDEDDEEVRVVRIEPAVIPTAIIFTNLPPRCCGFSKQAVLPYHE